MGGNRLELERRSSETRAEYGLKIKDTLTLTQRPSPFVLEFPPFVDTRFRRRLFLHLGLAREFGGILGAEVGWHVAR